MPLFVHNFVKIKSMIVSLLQPMTVTNRSNFGTRY